MSQTLEEIDTGKVIQARDMIDIEFRKIGLRLKTGPVPDSMFGLPIEVRDNERYSVFLTTMVPGLRPTSAIRVTGDTPKTGLESQPVKAKREES